MSEFPIVNVSQGALRGKKNVAKTGKAYYSFSGIPYAKPPLGRFRFKAPQPVESWSAIRDAQKEGNVCPQFDKLTQSYVGDEDCLFVNVHTPKLPGKGPSAELKTPVMVFVHGGGFTNGSGNAGIYGPDYLVSEDVLLVTFNYRLGALGFMTTEDREIPGNAGLKDMVAALKWVKQNISRFGGDPDNVTIFGDSAGSAAVHFLVLSPLTRGLFQRAIAQSGLATHKWAINNDGRGRTLRLAKVLGCTSEDSKEVLEFLKAVPPKQLVDHLLESLSPEERRRGVGEFPFVPVCEAGIKSSEEKFLPSLPLDIIKSGNYNKVPLIMGVTSDEGVMILRDMVNKPEVFAKVDKDFQGFLPEDIFPELDDPKSRAAAEKLKSFYLGNKPLSQETMFEFAKLCSDAHIVHKVYEAVKEHSVHATAATPLYFYEFAFDGKLCLGKKIFGLSSLPGVCHADDLGYLFYVSFMQPDLTLDSPEMIMVAKMVQMWTSFAKTGNPNAEVQWEPVTVAKTCYLRIDEESVMMENFSHERMSFWDELYKSSNSE